MWIGLNCELISLSGYLTQQIKIHGLGALAAMLTMHSFGRVVRRHEQEAILQHPSTWDMVYRAELEASKALRQDRARRANSTIPPTPTPRRLGWSGEPSVRIRSTASIVLPSRGPSPPPRRLPGGASASSARHDVDHLNPFDTPTRALPRHSVPSSPSFLTISLASPCSSELHIIPSLSDTASDTDMDMDTADTMYD